LCRYNPTRNFSPILHSVSVKIAFPCTHEDAAKIAISISKSVVNFHPFNLKNPPIHLII
jgi:hypothetical protein